MKALLRISKSRRVQERRHFPTGRNPFVKVTRKWMTMPMLFGEVPLSESRKGFADGFVGSEWGRASRDPPREARGKRPLLRPWSPSSTPSEPRVENAIFWTHTRAAWAHGWRGGAHSILSKDTLRLAPSHVLSAVQHFPVPGEKYNFEEN